MRNLFFIAAMTILPSLGLRDPILGVLVWNWIAFMNPHQMTFGFAESIPWAQLSVAVTAVGCIVNREPKRFPLNPTVVLIILFLAGISVTSLTALAPPDLVYDAWLRTAKMFGFFILTAALLNSRKRIHALLWMMAISFGFFAVYQGGAVLATAGGHHVQGPPNSMVSDNNEFGAAMLVALPLINFLRLQSRHRPVRMALAGVIVMGAITVLGTYSRGALLGIAAVAVIFWARSRYKLRTVLLIPLLPALGVWFMPESWMQRMDTIQNYQGDASVASRFEVWAEAVRIFQAHPLTGGGFKATLSQPVVQMFAPGFYPLEIHSIWFQVLGEQGAIVGAIWLGLTLVGIRNTFHLASQARRIPELAWCGDLARMMQCSIAAYCVAGTFLPIAYWDTYFTALVCLAAACDVAKAEARAKAEVRRRARAEAATGRQADTARPGPALVPSGRRTGAGSAWAAR